MVLISMVLTSMVYGLIGRFSGPKALAALP
jgi:hypothetical protein